MGTQSVFDHNISEKVRLDNLLSASSDPAICGSFGCRHVLSLGERRCGDLCRQCLYRRNQNNGYNFRNDPVFLDEIFANFYED